MNISRISESGTNNTIRWAIKNGADVKSDFPLQSIINDELCYLVTINDANFFELFRLTQMYRDKIRIINKLKADPLDRKVLETMFDGKAQISPDDPNSVMDVCDIANQVIMEFVNLVHQMENDDDIIRKPTLELFLPMLIRKYDIQIPVAFMDLIQNLDDILVPKIFNESYPSTLQNLIDNPNNRFIHNLMMGFVKSTGIMKYNDRYEKYLSVIKYSPLSVCKGNELYKFALSGFHKRDNGFKSEIRFSMFNPDIDNAKEIYKHMSMLRTPLEADFVVQLPIQYMQLLESSFGREVLTISYESSMKDIIDGGIAFDDFITPEFINDPEASQERIEEYNNSIEAYRVRISEANSMMLRAIPLILSDESSSDVSSTFSLLPAIYTTKGVLTINSQYKDRYLGIGDPLLLKMFEEMFSMIDGIQYDISRQ